jgi:hypothetical protein
MWIKQFTPAVLFLGGLVSALPSANPYSAEDLSIRGTTTTPNNLNDYTRTAQTCGPVCKISKKDELFERALEYSEDVELTKGGLTIYTTRLAQRLWTSGSRMD